MIATLIGISSSLITILIFYFLKRLDKSTIYGLILMGIEVAILSFLQASFFLVFAYAGIRTSPYFLVAGYFLHGVWDVVYPFIGSPDLLPPDYDYFCITYDFIVAFYLLLINYSKQQSLDKK